MAASRRAWTRRGTRSCGPQVRLRLYREVAVMSNVQRAIAYSSVAILAAVTVGSAAAEDVSLIEKLANGTPFSFVYGGNESKNLLPSWNKTSSRTALWDARERITHGWRRQRNGSSSG